MMVDFFRSGDCYQLFDNFISFLMIFCPDQEALARTNTTREQWWRSLMFKTTHDPVDVTNGNTTSLCPVFATCMSWPESVRNKRGAYWMLMLLPKGLRNLTMCLQYYFGLPDNPWGDERPAPITFDMWTDVPVTFSLFYFKLDNVIRKPIILSNFR